MLQLRLNGNVLSLKSFAFCTSLIQNHFLLIHNYIFTHPQPHCYTSTPSSTRPTAIKCSSTRLIHQVGAMRAGGGSTGVPLVGSTLLKLPNYRVSKKKRNFRMLLEPQCTGSITIGRHPLSLEIDFLVVSY